MSSLIQEAFNELYPEKRLKYSVSLKYSRKFKPYNANVKLHGSNLMFNLSKEWKKISNEIQIGLIQELLIKILKDRRKTMNMELYNLFMKNVHLAVPKTKTDENLEEAFDRVNDVYFNGMLDKPNLQWGNASTSKLGSYEYGSDTITISTIFKNAENELLDYVMYHEMLHKKFKFQSKNGRSLHHSSEFRKMEAKFPNRDFIEKEISLLARRHRLKAGMDIFNF
ncbi:SprT-like domain-containing protein [Candidatus Woesearchaeota archaeon]|nr:SprT-like domain-containing protein [Candidatus Woesearchaeota archaeon]